MRVRLGWGLVTCAAKNSGLVFLFVGVSMWFCMHSDSAGSRVEALPCNACKRQARFLTPYGLKCADHALETAIYDDASSEEGWLPIRIRPPSTDDTPKG